MKKLLPVLFLFVAASSYGQLEKGAMLIGVQTNFLAVNDSYYKTRTVIDFSGQIYGLTILPTFGYSLQRNWLIGAQATFGIKSSTNTYYTHFNTDLGIAPFSRYYLDLTKNKMWKLFAVAALEIVTTSSKRTYKAWGTPLITHYYTTSTFGSIGGGVSYFSKKLIVDASFSNAALRLGFYRVLPSRKK
jgi:hypothetical protein